jgi:hypothetical protein
MSPITHVKFYVGYARCLPSLLDARLIGLRTRTLPGKRGGAAPLRSGKTVTRVHFLDLVFEFNFSIRSKLRHDSFTSYTTSDNQ